MERLTWGLLNQALNYYPQNKLEPSTIEAYLAQWEKLILETSVSRFQDALEQCYRECVFFPAVADIAGRIPPALSSEQRAENDHITFASPDCPLCGGEGWLITHGGRTKGYNIIDENVGAARRCDCFARNQASGKTYVKRPGFHPTAADLKFRGSDEQKKLWRELKAAIAALSDKKGIPQAQQRAYIPTSSQLAQELAATAELRSGIKSRSVSAS